MIRPPLLCLLLLLLPQALAPCFAAGTSAGGAATIAAGISCTKITGQDLEFGVIIPDAAAASTVIVSPAGVRTKTGDCILLSIAPLPQAAGFKVEGTPNAPYTFSYPLGGLSVLEQIGQLETMVVDNWTVSPAYGWQLNSSGVQDVLVGATLHVKAGQKPGRYLGTFPVGVNY